MHSKIPPRVKWQGITYTFLRNKGNTIVYSDNPIDIYDDSNASLLIVEYRPHQSPKDRFYVLYKICAYSRLCLGDASANIELPNITGQNRMALPIWD